MLRALLSIMLISVLAGCATTQQSAEVNRLQLQVSQLEQKLQEREDQIDELKYEVQQSAGQNDNFDSEEVEEPNLDEPAAPRKMDSAKDKRIIRVAATPQQVQTALKNAGYYTGTIDGKIGPKTQDAIKAFQTDHALKGDGIVGNKTWVEMKNYLQ